MKSWFAASCLGALLLLAACASSVSPPEQPTQPPPEVQLPAEIKVGLLLPLSGPAGDLGQDMLDAAEMALFDVGENRLVLLPRDTVAGAPPDAVAIWNRLRLEVNIGQYLDVLGAADGTFDLERARRVARYKSGKYTVERPLHLGAALAGGLAELAEPLSAYGAPLGEAFQLRDDLLGVFGDPEVTGKPVGDDLREGKPTTLLVLARERAEPSDLQLLARVGSADLDDDDVAALRSHFERCGARAAVEAAIDELTAEALHYLDEAEMPAVVKAALRNLGHYVGRRDH